MKYGFIRCACCSPELVIADCFFNEERIFESALQAQKNGAEIIVFPELCITGYTCGDLFFQRTLQKNAEEALKLFIKKSSESDLKDCLIFLGLPLALAEGVFNCAAVILHGKLLALCPKSYLPNYGEFYERRQFTPFVDGKTQSRNIDFAGFEDVPFEKNILFEDSANPDLVIGCELCEDLWVPLPPSVRHCLAGATVIANLSAGNEIIGKAEFRRNLVKAHSARTFSAYLYANAGKNESTQDMVFAGHNLIAENGSLLAESPLFSGETIYADVDFERIAQERRKTTSFSVCVNNECPSDDVYYFRKKINLLKKHEKKDSDDFNKLNRYVASRPFVPSTKDARKERSLEVITLQSQGLAKRLRHIN
ncbi:MAG: NAD(+) synthase, partial [Treponemataceae bacterium]|nr:NAD(+) synthase [Treponemataceae bacterium]